MGKMYEHSLSDLAEAFWRALSNPDVLDRDRTTLDMVKAWMRTCLHSKARVAQFKLVLELARQQQYSFNDLNYCLMGLLLQKMLEIKSKLESKRMEYEPEHFHRYLFKTTSIILLKCLTDLCETMGNNHNEYPQTWVDVRGENTYKSMETIQYNISQRKQALLLKQMIKDNWQERELNVLCHDLESGSKAGSARLADESRDNVYQLHKRTRDKLKQTMETHEISETAGKLFIWKYLQDLCQNCPVLRTYREMGHTHTTGGKI